MTITRNQMFACNKGLVVEALTDGTCDLSCCGEPMALLTENTVDAAKEKHVPVVEKVAGGYKVKVGAVPHPMEAGHYIMFVELHAGNQVLRQYLKPGEAPEATFQTGAASVTAREYCNKHGLWKS